MTCKTKGFLFMKCIYFTISEFKLRVAKLTQQDGHVHALHHCRHSCVIWALSREADLSRFVYFFYAALELLVALHTYQT